MPQLGRVPVFSTVDRATTARQAVNHASREVDISIPLHDPSMLLQPVAQ